MYTLPHTNDLASVEISPFENIEITQSNVYEALVTLDYRFMQNEPRSLESICTF